MYRTFGWQSSKSIFSFGLIFACLSAVDTAAELCKRFNRIHSSEWRYAREEEKENGTKTASRDECLSESRIKNQPQVKNKRKKIDSLVEHTVQCLEKTFLLFYPAGSSDKLENLSVCTQWWIVWLNANRFRRVTLLNVALLENSLCFRQILHTSTCILQLSLLCVVWLTTTNPDLLCNRFGKAIHKHRANTMIELTVNMFTIYTIYLSLPITLFYSQVCLSIQKHQRTQRTHISSSCIYICEETIFGLFSV